MAGKLGKRVLDLLFPPKCVFCGVLTEGGAVCPDCERSLPFTGEKALRHGAGYGCCCAPLYYEDKARESLLRFKFSGCDHYAECYGELMARCAALELSGRFDLVTWVPVSAKRRRQRGYDQAELLAKSMCRLWETEPVRTLRKTRDNPPQSGIAAPEERRANVLGVYEAVEPERFGGRRLLLVDDILTTGSTLAEAARTLRLAGAAEVVCAALAMSAERD
ncbi:MAG: ComF family protein [Oscillospiraceae bacterium]